VNVNGMASQDKTYIGLQQLGQTLHMKNKRGCTVSNIRLFEDSVDGNPV
jgi:hypothetical protein